MHIIKFTIDTLLNFTFHKTIKPITPNSMDAIEKVTHKEQATLGMKRRETKRTTAVVEITDTMVVHLTRLT